MDNVQPILAGKFKLSIIGGALALLLANSTIWFNRTIYNSERFNQLTVDSLTSQSSRDAIATELTDRLLQNRPVLQNALGDRISKAISGLLDSNGVKKIYSAAANQLHLALTTKNPQPVIIDLTTLKVILVKTTNAIAEATQGSKQAVTTIESIPDNITLFDPSKIPNIYSLSITLLWLTPLFLLAGLVALIFPLYRYRRNFIPFAYVLLWEGISIFVAGIISLLFGPFFRPLILASINSEQSRIVAGNIYDTFLRSFNNQSYILLVVGLIITVIFIIAWYRRRRVA